MSSLSEGSPPLKLLSWRLGLATLGLLVAGSSAALAAGQSQPTVVELFTSQGCSSCPPANANLITLSSRPGVLALSFNVTYWDQLGWKDSFGKPEFTTRQRVYEPSLGENGPFTPQMVVNGRADVVGNRIGEVDALIRSAERPSPPEVAIRSDRIAIGAGKAPAKGADIWLVRYDPRIINVAVARGENSGRTLPHKNVVRELTRIGSWNGNEVSFPLKAAGSGLKVAVLVQTQGGGPILAASTN